MDDLNALIHAAQEGDRDAFSQLLTEHYDLIFRFALKWCGNREDAEDVTQQSCIKLAKNIEQFRFESAFTSWLYRLVINCAKDWQKSQKKHSDIKVIPEEAVEYELKSSDKAETFVYLKQIINWADSLGEGFKETLILVFAEGLTHAEAGTILKIKESTVSWRIHQIRSHLDDRRREE